jgi:nucleoid-associated protein YgaU
MATAATTHTVVEGDTLGALAVRYYGKESLWTKIQDANPTVVPEKLKIGSVLQIPAG